MVLLADGLTGATLATEETGADGEVLFESLAEGDYVVTVTAEGHDFFRRSVHVSGAPNPSSETVAAARRRNVLPKDGGAPGITAIRAFLPCQTVRYTFTVVPTTVEDHYTLTVESVFETQVPIPVITVDPPSVDLSLFEGDEFQINFTVSNQGLIAAQNVEFQLPSTAEVQMTPLIRTVGRAGTPRFLQVVEPGIGRRPGPDRLPCLCQHRCHWNQHRRVLRHGDPRRPRRGGSSAEGINLTLPTEAGRYWIWVVANSQGVVSESAEFNHRASTVVPILVQAAGSHSMARRSATQRRAKTAGDPGEEGSVCARVRLRLDQRAVLARDALKARLELSNDTEAGLTELEVTLDIRDRDGQPAGGVFGIRPPTVEGLGGVDGSGSVGAMASGTAEWILIPTLNAAPTTGIRTFLVGGTIVYRQDGVRVTVPLTPAPIDVHPQPELVVRYFHERDVFADDPFTRALEPSVPYALAAQILNVGHGAARSLKISGGQPQIIENEKDLLIEFRAIGTRIENQQVSPSLDVDFGEIAPGTNKLARWLFTSSLQGSFTNYSATVRHEDAIAGVERLSLIRSVEIHELNHIVEAGGTFTDGRPDLLVNDEPDADRLPDTLYLSDGTTRPVTGQTNGLISGVVSDTNLRLRLDVALPRGWSYLRIEQPGGTNYQLRQVLRPDGTDVGIGTNAWITDRFIRGGSRRPLRVDHLHLLDFDAPAYYTLVYAPAPPAVPDGVAPESQVTALPLESPLNFQVGWTGTDESSGVFAYNIYTSIDGGAFRLWLTNTPLSGAVYAGETGHTYGFHSSAIDRAGNIEALRSTADATTEIRMGNRPPVADVVAPLVVARGDLLETRLVASDPDPDQILFYTLVSGAPRGLALDARTGAIHWQTGDGDQPGTDSIRFRIADNGIPSANITVTLPLTWVGTNRPPSLTRVGDLVVSEGTRVRIPLSANDPDIPRQNLTLTLVEGPSGAAVDAAGVFQWRPRGGDGPGTNRVVIRVTDNGVPPSSTESAFTLFVRDTSAELLVGVGTTNLFSGKSSRLPLSINADPGVTNIAFRLPLPPGRLGALRLSDLADDVLSATLANVQTESVQVRLELRPGTSLTATRRIADLRFTSDPEGESGLFVLDPSRITGIGAAGIAVDNTASIPGVLVLVRQSPVLEILPPSQLVLFGHAGRSYRLEWAPAVDGPWQSVETIRMPPDSVTLVREVDTTEATRLLRAIEVSP